MNPILTAIQNKSGNKGNENLLKSLMTGNPEKVYEQMINTNPQFRRFVLDNKGKTPEQIAKAYGLDLNNILNRFGAQKR